MPCAKTCPSQGFPGIFAVNAVVLCCWGIPSMQGIMIKYFTSNPGSTKEACFLMNLQRGKCEHCFDSMLNVFPTRNNVPPYDLVLLQPLLQPPHDGQHVRPVGVLVGNRPSLRKEAVSCGLPVCW